MKLKLMIKNKILEIRVDNFLRKLKKINEKQLPVVEIVPFCDQVKTGKNTTVFNKNYFIQELLLKTSPTVLNALSSDNKFDMHFLANKIFSFNDDFDFNENHEFDFSNFNLCGESLKNNSLFYNDIIDELIYTEETHKRKTGKYILIVNAPEQFFQNKEFSLLFNQVELNHEEITHQPFKPLYKIEKI